MKHRSMTVMRSGMILVSAALFAGLVWMLWRRIPWAAVRYGILALCAAIYAVVGLWAWYQRRQVELFADDLCETLDALISGRTPEGFHPYEDSLTAKVQGKLLQYFDIMNEGKRQSQRDKETIQGLVSDISHQVKTPIANINEELYLSAMSPWDYSIADGSAAMSMQQYNQNSESITEETVETIRNRPEVTSVSALKSHEVKLTASETLRKRVVDFYNQPYDETMTLRETQEGYPGWIAGLDRLAKSGEYTAVVIGMEGEYLNYLMENCPATSGEFDPDAFAEGRFVLVGGAYYDGISSLAAGETLQLEGRNFEVMASLMHDASYLSGSNSTDAAFTFFYILPLSVFDELYPGQCYRQIAVDIDHSQQDSFEAFLEEFEQGLNRGIGITLRSEYQENLRNARLNTVLVPLIVGLVLMGIALLNFGNLLVAKVFARRQEFAVYQSLGMTGEQLKKLMILEGILYSLLMALVLIPADVLFARIVMPGVIRDFSWASVYHFTLLPLWIALPVMILLAMAVPLLCLHAVTKGTIQERLRMME